MIYKQLTTSAEAERLVLSFRNQPETQKYSLNIKHQELVPKINQALVSMTREGRIEQIKREYIEELKSL